MDKQQTMSMLNCSVDDNLNIQTTNTSPIGITLTSTTGSCWDYWHQNYYPYVVRESYPVYIQERAQDKGKKAFEIIKILKDKRFVQLEKVSDFIDLMDELIKII